MLYLVRAGELNAVCLLPAGEPGAEYASFLLCSFCSLFKTPVSCSGRSSAVRCSSITLMDSLCDLPRSKFSDAQHTLPAIFPFCQSPEVCGACPDGGSDWQGSHRMSANMSPLDGVRDDQPVLGYRSKYNGM